MRGPGAGGVLAALLLTLALPVAADDRERFVLAIDFRPGDVYRYEMVLESRLSTSGGPDRIFRVEIDSSYEVESVSEEGFTILVRLEAIEIPETSAELPAPIRGVLAAIGKFEIVIDERWNVVRVRGLGRILDDLLEGRGDPLEEIGRAVGRGVESLLGPAVSSVLDRSEAEKVTYDARRLFALETLAIGEAGGGETENPILGRTRESFEVLAIGSSHDRPTCRTRYERTVEFGGVLRLLGYERSSTEEESTRFANGLTVRSMRRSLFTTSDAVGVRLATEVLLRLVDVDSDPEKNSGRDH